MVQPIICVITKEKEKSNKNDVEFHIESKAKQVTQLCAHVYSEIGQW